MKKNILITREISKILNYLEDKSPTIIEEMKKETSAKYLLVQKYLTHSDIASFGKRKGKQALDTNLLYYLTVDEMEDIEKSENKKFESAKQSNISVPKELFEEIGIGPINRRTGPQEKQHEHQKLNEFAKIVLVNDTIEYFDIGYTRQVMEKLNKNAKWRWEDYKLNLSNEKFTEIQLSQAVHGVGIKDDAMFHKLRRSMFRTDIIVFLIKTDINNNKTMYIMLEKNPKFFTIIKQNNIFWEKYVKTRSKKARYELQTNGIEDVNDEKNRKYQNKWRKMLAEEMMNYTTVDGEVFCPLTYIRADFNNTSPLFVASHIKGYKDCNSEEEYDINNGILICANADALFDHHLITIDENKNIIFSFLIDNNEILKQQLLLNQIIFKPIFTENRMKYLKHHKELFDEKEQKRKCGDVEQENGVLQCAEKGESYNV
ncbi:MAG: HNH endonuclease signature motif containing protein [Bacilli bacterium]